MTLTNEVVRVIGRTAPGTATENDGTELQVGLGLIAEHGEPGEYQFPLDDGTHVCHVTITIKETPR